jgi:hypothetical protein
MSRLVPGREPNSPDHLPICNESRFGPMGATISRTRTLRSYLFMDMQVDGSLSCSSARIYICCVLYIMHIVFSVRPTGFQNGSFYRCMCI